MTFGTIIVVCLIGWLVNFFMLASAVEDQPEGAMGTGFLVIPVLVPFALAAFYLIAKIAGLILPKD